MLLSAQNLALAQLSYLSEGDHQTMRLSKSFRKASTLGDAVITSTETARWVVPDCAVSPTMPSSERTVPGSSFDGLDRTSRQLKSLDWLWVNEPAIDDEHTLCVLTHSFNHE